MRDAESRRIESHFHFWVVDAAGPASSVAETVIGVAEALRRGELPPSGGSAVARARGEGPD